MFFTIALILIATIGFLNRWLLRKANDKIWQAIFIDKTAKLLPYSIIIFALIWGAGTLTGLHWLRLSGATLTAITLILNFVLLITLPFSFGTKLLDKFISSFRRVPETPVNPSRRLFLKGAAASVPLFAVSGVGNGIASSFSETRFPQVSLDFADLPNALDGFKILHLSDLHLGYYFGLDHLEKTLLDAEKYQVHMVMVTGDIADDLSLMTDAMKLVDQLKTPFSKYVAVGNHEYFRGIREAIQMINAGPVPLLLNKHEVLDIYGTKIVVGGADYPVCMRANIQDFLDKSVQTVFKNAPENTFRILLSHRPRALDVAQKHAVNLVLSGHTHGGQVGLAGRSAWEIFNENGYLWGHYQKDSSQLYTSAGMGHWFPFRLNCPLEAPVITLKKV